MEVVIYRFPVDYLFTSRESWVSNFICLYLGDNDGSVRGKRRDRIFKIITREWKGDVRAVIVLEFRWLDRFSREGRILFCSF